MADLDLRPERRQALAAKVVAALTSAVAGSAASLRGSLATGSADGYSDIDALWVVPDDRFSQALGTAGEALATVGPVSSLRIDPSLAKSDRRRLVFARFAGLPVFWRLDLDVRAGSVSAYDRYDDDNPAARSTSGWSRPASAIENATAAIKAGVRRQDDIAKGLLARGFDRIERDGGPMADLPDAITRLADYCAEADPALATRARELHEIVNTLVSSGQLPRLLY
jgi:hypothetical protein